VGRRGGRGWQREGRVKGRGGGKEKGRGREESGLTMVFILSMENTFGRMWAIVNEPHLTVLTFEPHTVRSQAVLICHGCDVIRPEMTS